MTDWRDWYTGWSGGFTYPDAPAGGAGPGHARPPGPIGRDGAVNGPVPHPDAPTARVGHTDFARIDLDERAGCVYEAIKQAQVLVGPAIKEETGYALNEVLSGILPGLVLTLSILGLSSAVGGLAGAAVGALGGGIGALPGAAAGAAVGFKAGLLLLNVLGLGFLAFYLTTHLSQVVTLLTRGLRTAWDAPTSPMDTRFPVDGAAQDIAHSIAVLIRLILEGIVAFLLAKGAASAASRVPEVVAQLRKSKLGEGFATWVEQNWQGLITNKKLRGRVEKEGLGSGRDKVRAATSEQQARMQASVGLNSPEMLVRKFLGETKVRNVTARSAEDVNAWWRNEKGYTKEPYRPGTEILEFELAESKTFVRTYDEVNSFKKGGWLMKKEDIAGLTPEQIRDKFALPQTPQYITDVKLPAGTRLRIGEANGIAGWGDGGGAQVDMMGRRGIGEQWLNPRSIK